VIAAYSRKQDGILYKIPCKHGKVYIGETVRSDKEEGRDINRFART